MQDVYPRAKLVGLVISTMAICTTLKEVYTQRNLRDPREESKQRVLQIASDTASYSRTCETDIVVDDKTNKMSSMSISLCNNKIGDRDSIDWKKLKPFNDTLRRLHVRKNDFLELNMDSINNLTALEEFNLAENQYLQSIDGLPTVPTLQTIRVVRNGDIDQGVKMTIDDMSMSTLTNLVNLQVCNCNLPNTGIPIDVFNFPSLQTLDISNNEGGFTNIGAANWSNSLRHISLESTKLTGDLSPTIFTSATHVYLSDNRITGTITMQRGSTTKVLMASNNAISVLDIQDTAVNTVNVSSQSGELTLKLKAMYVIDTLDISRNELCIDTMHSVTCKRLIMSHLKLNRGLMIPNFDFLVIWGSQLTMSNVYTSLSPTTLDQTKQALKDRSEVPVTHKIAHVLVRQPLAMILWLIAIEQNTVTTLTMEGAYRNTGTVVNVPNFRKEAMRDILAMHSQPDNVVVDPASRSGLRQWFGVNNESEFTFLND